MPAVVTDLIVEQGTTWNWGWQVTFNGDPIDASWTCRSQVRAQKSSTTVLHEFTTEVNAEGVALISVTPAESTSWTWVFGYYDVEVVSPDELVVLRVSQGTVKVDPEVTR